ncbi:MAG: IS3 family transposase [Thermodesulfovibrionales bacterium]|nr:IS3 family transposase [Thermodesulfovibrionales bacterium]
MEEKREFLADHREALGGIKRGCEMLNMVRSSYYYKEGVNLQKQKEEADLRDRIEKIVVEYERYGYRRVTTALQREGLKVNHKRVQRIMQEEELICKIKKRWIVTTDSNHPYPVYPHLLKDAKITGVNQAWVADITYIRILMAFVYLAVILDVFSRKVVGWAISLRIDTELTRMALRMAIETRRPPKGCIRHWGIVHQMNMNHWWQGTKTGIVRPS